MSTGLDNLEIYKLAERLEVFVYKLIKKFPDDEKYRAVDQLNRSSSAVSNNIAEGYGRYSFQDKINKFYIARGEAEETRKGINKSQKKGFISVKEAGLCDKNYTQLIKQINAYINFLRRHQNPNPQVPKYPSTQSISLIITILIISSILVSTITVGDVIIRHSQTVKGSEVSENAYFAAESALEKANYAIIKNYDNVSSYTLSGSMTNTATYEITDVSLDDRASFEVALRAGESFELVMDFNGTDIYPANITLTQAGSVSTDLIIYECTTAGTPRVCDSGYTQTFVSSIPSPFYILPYNDANVFVEETKYYKIRINNLDALASETYTLTPSAGNFPVGIDITAKGVYGGYERQAKSSFPKFQVFGVD